MREQFISENQLRRLTICPLFYKTPEVLLFFIYLNMFGLNSSLLSVFVFFTLQLFVHTCTNPVTIDSSQCQFYINYNDQKCDQFSFDHCRWRYCSQFTTNNPLTAQCSQYTYKDEYSWVMCRIRCCSYSFDFDMDADGLDSCRDYVGYWSKKKNRDIAISMSVVFGGPVFIILMCAYCCRDETRNNCSNIFRRFNKWPCFDGYEEVVINPPIVEDVWLEKEKKEGSSSQIVICGICQDGGCEWVLECSHSFHRRCIIPSLQENSQCPTCQSKALTRVTMYCRTCMQKQYHTNLPRALISANTTQICTECSNNNPPVE